MNVFIGMLGTLLVVVGLVLLLLDLIRKKSKKKSLIVLAVGLVLFIGGLATSGKQTSNSATENNKTSKKITSKKQIKDNSSTDKTGAKSAEAEKDDSLSVLQAKADSALPEAIADSTSSDEAYLFENAKFVVKSAEGKNATNVYLLTDKVWTNLEADSRKALWTVAVEVASELTDKMPVDDDYPHIEVHATAFNGQGNFTVATPTLDSATQMRDAFKGK